MSNRGPARSAAAASAPAGESGGETAELEAIADASLRAGSEDGRASTATARRAACGAPVPSALAVGRVRRVDAEGAWVEVGGRLVGARVDAAVHRDVVETACERGEMVLLTLDAEGHATVVGALRTQPTPGVDAMDTISLKARRIELEAGEELQLRSGIAVVALRAIGEVETYADRIVSRAEELQKIVGRMLRLN